MVTFALHINMFTAKYKNCLVLFAQFVMLVFTGYNTIA